MSTSSSLCRRTSAFCPAVRVRSLPMCVAAFAFIAVILLMAWRSTNQTPGSPPLQNADRQSASPSVTIHTFDSYRRASNQAIAGESPPSPLRICLVTLQLAGLTQNSGMGVAVASLATVLASAGHTVSILYAATPRADWPHWRAHYAALGVELAMLPAADTRLWPTGRSHRVRIAWQCYQWLRERQVALNLVYFHDWHGIGYFATQAKRQALDFAQTLLATIVHCPVSFFRHGNSQHTAKITTLLADHMELNQVRSSDLVISPSRFMLDWVVRERGWTLPSGEGRVFVQPNVLSAEVLKAIPLVDHDRKQLIHANELVFFGRLEKLKGLVTFLDALDWLATMMPSERRITITFLGQINTRGAVETIQQRSRDAAWPFAVQFQSNLGHAAAIQYLASGSSGKLVLLLSAIENSPYAVLECLALGIPFLAMDVGGIAELIPVEQRQHVLVSPADRLGGGSSAERVAKRMLRAVLDGVRADTTAVPAATPAGARDAWIGFHDAHGRVQSMLRDGRKAAQQEQRESVPLLVSVVICHHDRGLHLIESIRSVLHQTHARIELVVVDDGSVEAESLAVLELLPSALAALHLPLHQRARVSDHGGRQARGELNMDARANQNDALLAYMMDRWRGGLVLDDAHVVLNANQMPGASRNLGVQNARGDWVAFLDDDDLARPHWLATLLGVAQATRASVATSTLDFFSDADWRPWEAALTDASDRFRDTSAIAVQAQWLPVGAAVSAGLFENVFGAYAALWHRHTLLQLGGFTEEVDSTFEDWELFATAVLAGRSLELVADPLLLYRQYLDASRAVENHTASEHTETPSAAAQQHLMSRGGSAAKYLNEQRAMRPYLRAAPASMRNALELAAGLYRGGGGSQ